MEHAKKMFLINPESFQKLQSSADIINPNTLSHLDMEMKEVLNSKIKDYEKWSKYQQVLQRFLHFSNNARESITVPILEEEKVKEESDPASPIKNDYLTVEQILDTVPKNLKNKSAMLLQHITKNRYLYWNEKGEVMVNNQLLKGSNIIDIVNDLLRDRQPKDKKNKDIIVKSLKQINTPMEFIRSKAYLDYFKNYTTPSNSIREFSLIETDDSLSSNKQQKTSSKSLKSKQEQRFKENSETPKKKKKKTNTLFAKIDWDKY